MLFVLHFNGLCHKMHNATLLHNRALDELGTSFARGISAVLANRLMISVRRHYYGHEHDQTIESASTTMRFESAPSQAAAETDTSATEVEFGASASSGATITFDSANPTESASGTYGDNNDRRGFSERVGF